MPELEGSVMEGEIISSESTELETTEPSIESGETPESTTQITTTDPRQTHQLVRSTLAELKTKNPSVSEALRTSYYISSDLKKDFPGGVQEVRALKQAVDQHGGVEAIQERMSELSFFKELDTQFTASSPAFVDVLSSADPAAFVNLSPAILQKYEELAPESFSSWFANRSLADIQGSGLIDGARWLLRVAGDNAEVKQYAEGVMAYIQRLQGFASKPIGAPATLARTTQPDNLSQREQELNIREYRSEHAKTATRLFASELNTQLAGRKPTPVQMDAIVELVNNALNRSETPEDKKKIDRFYAAGDKDGYVKFKKAIWERVLPKAIESALGATIGRKAGVPAKKAPVVNARTAAAQQQGIKQVTQTPANHLVNYGRGGTTQTDVLNDIYRLKSGEVVQVRR